MAVINRMNSTSVDVIAITAVLCIAISAQFESITAPDTVVAPEFFLLTAIVATSSFGDAVQASIPVTCSTLLHIHAVHTWGGDGS